MKRDYMLTLVACLALGLSIAGLFIRTSPQGRRRADARERGVLSEMGLEDRWIMPGAGPLSGNVLNDPYNLYGTPNVVPGQADGGNFMARGTRAAGQDGWTGRGLGGGMCLYRCPRCGNCFQGQTNGGGLVGPNCPNCRCQTQRIR